MRKGIVKSIKLSLRYIWIKTILEKTEMDMGITWSHFITAHLGLHSDWDFGCAILEPYVLADYHYFDRESFKEHGANSLNLNVFSKTQNVHS